MPAILEHACFLHVLDIERLVARKVQYYKCVNVYPSREGAMNTNISGRRWIRHT